VAGARRAPAPEHQSPQFVQSREQCRVLAQPPFVQPDALAALAVLADHERVAPLRGAPYVNVVALALAVNRAWLAELHMRWDE
jgi:hypothetical protein